MSLCGCGPLSCVQVGADGVVCGGGASVYFSHSLQLLLFSYMNGTRVCVCVRVCVHVCVCECVCV